MWKTSVGAKINPIDDDGDWETDPDFINDVTEQEQRWGSKTIEGSGRTAAAIDMHKLREETTRAYELSKQKEKPDGSYGYGGKFGVEKDRMDKCAVGHDYVAKVEKHVSQTDYKGGFGGKFGVQTDRVDKSAAGWDHKETIEKHASQKDYSQGFGGKYGVEKDRQDKSAVGWDYVEKLQKHDSQNVGKNQNIITEQIQRPSQLKAKFENLAKQNEAKPVEKIKSIPAQKKTPVVNKFTAQNVQEEKIVEKREEKREFKMQEEKKQEIKQEVKQEIKQEFKQEVKHEYKQEIKNEYKQEIKQEVKREEIPVEEPPVVINQTEAVPKEINANIMISQEDADKLVQELEDESNYTAIALYDYQATADDEISFDPDDIITNIEMIDEGWWRGTCHGITGLFPANYVQLQDQ